MPDLARKDRLPKLPIISEVLATGLQKLRVLPDHFLGAVSGHPGEGWVDVLNRGRDIGNHDGFADLPNRGRDKGQTGIGKAILAIILGRCPGQLRTIQIARPVQQRLAIQGHEFFGADHPSTCLTTFCATAINRIGIERLHIRPVAPAVRWVSRLSPARCLNPPRLKCVSSLALMALEL